MRRSIRVVEGVLVAGIMLAMMTAGCTRNGGPAESAQEGAVAGRPQTTCPVMEGNSINRKIYADYDGKRVYFCCASCPGQFAKDPEKYMKTMRESGILLEDVPKPGAEAGGGQPEMPAMEDAEDHAGHAH